MKLNLPAKTLDYLLIGLVAGIIAAIVLIAVFGMTFSAIEAVTTSIKVSALKKP